MSQGHEMGEAPRKVKWRIPRDHVLAPYIKAAIEEGRDEIAMWLLEKAGVEATETDLVTPEDDKEGRQRGRLTLPGSPSSPSSA